MINNEELCKVLIIDSLQRAVKYYGLEGTLEAIDRVYDKSTKINFLMKKTFFEIFLKK